MTPLFGVLPLALVKRQVHVQCKVLLVQQVGLLRSPPLLPLV